MGQTNKAGLSLFISFLLLSCSNSKTCSGGKSKEGLLQEYSTPEVTFSLWNVEQGAFGANVDLRICDVKSQILIEEIGLRGEDYLPHLDSVVGRTIYIHYNFPRNQDRLIESLEFKSVVLGDALLDSTRLKYRYLFTNVKEP